MIPDERRLRALVRGALVAAALGAAGLLAGWLGDPRQALFSYLTAYAYVASLALGALLFLMIVNAMDAGWPVLLRRLVEAVVGALPVLAVLVIPILAGLRWLYPWLHPEAAPDERARRLLEHKAPYLNAPFFVARTVGYFAIWVVVGELLRRSSLAPARRKALSAGALPAVALALAFASFDWLMSLTPTWVSTMFPVYYFAGGFLGALALLTLLTYASKRSGLIPEVSESHFYALGRLLLAFVSFWAYAAFFQLLIVWLADKPEEVAFYAARVRGPWGAVSVVLAVVQFVLPFFALLGYRLKRRGAPLAAVAAWLLAAHWLDVDWLVAPSLRTSGSPYHWLDLAALLAVGGASLGFGVARLRGVPLVPLNDPGLPAAVRYVSR